MSKSHKPEPIKEISASNDTAWLLERIWSRMHERNEHFIGCLVGREGSGKSMTAIKIADTLDARFDAGKNVFFHLDNFLEVLANDEFEQGDIFVLDEAGVQLGSRTWQERAQVLGNQSLQLIRSHNVGLIFTLPSFSELDKQARGRVQLLFKLVNKVDGEYVSAKPMRVEPDREGNGGEPYTIYPRRTNQTARGVQSTRPVKRVEFSPPEDATTEAYLELKEEFQAEQYQETIAELRGEGGEDDNEKDPERIAEEIVDDERIDDFIREINNGAQQVIDKHSLKTEFDIGAPRAKQVKRLLMDEVDDTEVM